MTSQHKEDIVCAFHGDIEIWMESIDKKLDKLLLWKATVIGYSMGATAVVIGLFKIFKVI